ncbi:MAG: thiamine diphosphokinase [Epulopiscium sp.]|nr:thiamine diphosphokinase [Candidatus Epulonipiscium sp.]
MKTLMIVNGTIENYDFYLPWVKDFQWIICVDGGIIHAKKLGLTPDIIIGDLDSAPVAELSFFQNQKVPIQLFPKQKDKTDTQLALEYAIEKGASFVTIIGALGTRFDHTLGNVHVLDLALDKKIPVVLINEYNHIYLISDRIDVNIEQGKIISLIPFTPQVTGVYTKGLLYPLKNATLFAGVSYGISNEIIDTDGSISIDKGKLLVIQARE